MYNSKLLEIYEIFIIKVLNVLVCLYMLMYVCIIKVENWYIFFLSYFLELKFIYVMNEKIGSIIIVRKENCSWGYGGRKFVFIRFFCVF